MVVWMRQQNTVPSTEPKYIQVSDLLLTDHFCSLPLPCRIGCLRQAEAYTHRPEHTPRLARTGSIRHTVKGPQRQSVSGLRSSRPDGGFPGGAPGSCGWATLLRACTERRGAPMPPSPTAHGIPRRTAQRVRVPTLSLPCFLPFTWASYCLLAHRLPGVLSIQLTSFLLPSSLSSSLAAAAWLAGIIWLPLNLFFPVNLSVFLFWRPPPVLCGRRHGGAGAHAERPQLRV